MYLKRPITQESLDIQRVNLSVREDALDLKTEPDAPQRLSPEPLCDFCGGPGPVTIYAANRMANGDPVQCWRWNACAACERLVDGNQWGQMEQIMAERFKQFFAARLQAKFGAVPEQVITEAVHQSLQQFHDYAVRVMDAGAGKTGLQGKEMRP